MIDYFFDHGIVDWKRWRLKLTAWSCLGNGENRTHVSGFAVHHTATVLHHQNRHQTAMSQARIELASLCLQGRYNYLYTIGPKLREVGFEPALGILKTPVLPLNYSPLTVIWLLRGVGIAPTSSGHEPDELTVAPPSFVSHRTCTYNFQFWAGRWFYLTSKTVYSGSEESNFRHQLPRLAYYRYTRTGVLCQI